MRDGRLDVRHEQNENPFENNARGKKGAKNDPRPKLATPRGDLLLVAIFVLEDPTNEKERNRDNDDGDNDPRWRSHLFNQIKYSSHVRTYLIVYDLKNL